MPLELEAIGRSQMFSFAYSRNAFPENIVMACFQQQSTVYVPKMDTAKLVANTTEYVRTLQPRNQMNAMGKKFFSPS